MVSTMYPEHPNATAYKATAEAFRSGDREVLATLIDADVVWHVPLVGDVRGRDRLIEWLGELLAQGFWLTEHDVFGNDEHVCALSIMGVKRGEIDVQTRVVSVFHFRDGKQCERWIYPEDSEVWKQILPA
jgi:ketosteroid isomerase-like protein